MLCLSRTTLLREFVSAFPFINGVFFLEQLLSGLSIHKTWLVEDIISSELGYQVKRKEKL